MTTKLVLNQIPATSAKAARSNFGLQGVLVLDLGGKEIGRVPVYTRESLPPEDSAYTKNIVQRKHTLILLIIGFRL